MTVLVSIAYFGVPDLIERSVRSVLAQTHTDLQLVVIGDGEEPPLDVRDDRLEVHVLPYNRGPYFCQAVALGASSHEWYATVGADDWVAPDHLERLLAVRASAAVPTWFFRDEHRELAGPAPEFGITTTERLRGIGGFNASERIAQDALNVRLLREHGGIVKTRYATYHHVTREGSLTQAPETSKGSPARVAVHERNRAVLRATQRMGLAEIQAYRSALIPPRIRHEVAEQADRLAGRVAA